MLRDFFCDFQTLWSEVTFLFLESCFTKTLISIPPWNICFFSLGSTPDRNITNFVQVQLEKCICSKDSSLTCKSFSNRTQCLKITQKCHIWTYEISKNRQFLAFLINFCHLKWYILIFNFGIFRQFLSNSNWPIW